METADKLVILKQDLQMLTDDSDAYLTTLLSEAEINIAIEGITDDESMAYNMAIIHYAAYLFRKRGADDTAMPRFLRYELNNLLFSQKAKEPEDGNGDDI